MSRGKEEIDTLSSCQTATGGNELGLGMRGRVQDVDDKNIGIHGPFAEGGIGQKEGSERRYRLLSSDLKRSKNNP